HHFLPPSARLVLASALGHYDHWYSSTHTATCRDERSEIIPAVDRDYIRICLLQRRPKRPPKFGFLGILVCCFGAQRNFFVTRKSLRRAPRVLRLGRPFKPAHRQPLRRRIQPRVVIRTNVAKNNSDGRIALHSLSEECC